MLLNGGILCGLSFGSRGGASCSGVRLTIFIVRESFPGGFAITAVKIHECVCSARAIGVFAIVGLAISGLAFRGLILLF